MIFSMCASCRCFAKRTRQYNLFVFLRDRTGDFDR